MNQGAWILLAAVVLACAFGAYRMLRDGRFRAARASASLGAVSPGGADPAAAPDSGPALGSVLDGTDHALGERATLLQFSSAFCAPCRTTRVVLADVAALVPGVAHVEVDAEKHLDLVRRLHIQRTPTTLVLDPQGREVSRAAGAPRKQDVLAALGPLA
ncbi:MAG TPA: thioredoxin family protein [Nocardioidaceae bacterium]|nr:thioredoxin family protein [Nocardioidaceae bacterium]